MRERIARLLAVVTLLLALALGAIFAWMQNPGWMDRVPATDAPPSEDIDTARLDEGRAVLERESCLRCHSLAGNGNPRVPLDGIGARRERDAIRDGIVAGGEAAEQLPDGLRETKRRYRDLPDADMAALLDRLVASRD